ncbi:DUF4189 domain-containing protein [Sphingopyxis fribergensis]
MDFPAKHCFLKFAALASLGLLLSFAPSKPVAAQDYICPSGAGPGETVIGMHTPAPGASPVPICRRTATAPQGAPQGSAMPQIQMMPYVRPRLHGVHVTDVDRTQLYSSNWNQNPQNGLNMALEYCQQQTGKACVSLGGFVDECQAIVIDAKRATYRGRDTDPRFAARLAMADCGKSGPIGQCRLWRLPLCSGLGYGEGNYAGNDNGRTREQIKAEIETMTEELVAELK